MNTKSAKQCKHPKKMKSSKTSAKPEVFVLPPDILKQLGISIGLGNVNQDTIPAPPKIIPNTAVSNYDNSSNIATSGSSGNTSDSSFLETANLMKKSVFLSPTFVPTVANVIPGEIQLLCHKNTDSSVGSETELVDGLNSVFEPVDSIKVPGVLAGANNIGKDSFINDETKISGEMTVNGLYTPVPNVELDEDAYEDTRSFDDNEMQIDSTISSKNLIVQESKFDDLFAENSNNNLITSKNTNALVHIFDKKASSDIIQRNNTKINIISEETIPISKLKELQLHSSLTPVPVNTVIAPKKVNEKRIIVPVDTCEKNPVVIMSNTEVQFKETNEIHSESHHSNNNIHMDKDHNLEPLDTTSHLQHKHSIREVEVNLETCHSANIIDENLNGVNVLTVNDGKLETSEQKDYIKKSTNVVTSDSDQSKSDLNEQKTTNNTELTIHDQISDENQCSSEKDIIENGEAEGECALDTQNICKQNPENLKRKQVKHNFVKSKTTGNHKQDKNKSSLDAHNNLPIIIDEKGKPLLNEELVKSFNVSDENSSNISKSDKVKEIAAYLKKLSHIYTDKKKMKACLANDSNEKETIQSNTNMIKSKLCIQGVEKPGGVLSEHHGESKVIKTYAKCNKQKPSKKSTYPLNSDDTFVAVEVSDLELNTVEISQICLKQEFCMCNDFGRIAYYDYDDLCEHIHFANNTTNSELDLIFSIYSDEVLVNNNSEIEIVEAHKTEEIVETLNFCWNVMDGELLDIEQIQDKITINSEDSSCFDKSTRVSGYIDDTRDKNNSTVTEIHDQVDAAMNVEDTDGVLETVDHAAENTNCDSISIDNDKCLKANVSFLAVSTDKKEKNDRKDRTTESELIPTSASEIKPSESGDDSKKITNITRDDDNDTSKIREPKDKSAKTPKKKDERINEDAPKSKENMAKKRRLSDMSLTATSQKKDEPSPKKNIKCALCNNLFSEEEWEHHVDNQHQHIAWKEDQSIDLENPELIAKLNKKLKKGGVLECPFCDTEKKKLKNYVVHVRKCIKEKVTSSTSKDKSTRRHRTEVVEHITCGVCQKSVEESNWIEHIGKEHNYLSWKEGQEDAWNFEDETLVAQHLLNIKRGHGNLICYKCGLKRKRVKLYLAHIKTCDGSGVNLDDSMNVDVNTSNLEIEPVESKTVKCGVCQEDMPTMKWMDHIAKEHNYLAWQEGEPAVDLEDEEAVWKHLLQIIRDYGCLICHKCGLNRRRVKMFLSHIKSCDGTGVSFEDSYLSDFNSSNVEALESNVDEDVECGVCNQTMLASDWVDHICKTHNYMAWKVEETPLDLNSEEAIWNHLQQYIRTSDGLICYKCGLQRKRVKLYLSHIKTCDGNLSQGDNSVVSLDNTNTWFEVPIETQESKLVKCGVCNETVSIPQWMEHIAQQHNYLAWPAESPPLDLEDESALRVHLLNISKQIGGLICNICGKNIKYSKTYLVHVKECTGVPVVPEDNSSNNPTSSINSIVNKKTIKTEPLVCGVCENKVDASDWLNHIHKAHQYIAWVEGQQPIDINDHAMVQRHLNEVSKLVGGLQCLKCGVRRKYVKTYLQHVETCDGTMCTTELSTAMMNKDELECAVCSVKVVPKDWRDHAMKEHYNIAWVVGDLPIDLNSPYLVEGYIKEYLRRFHKLVCKVCGASRVSCVGFYAHILTCGKTEEETEQFKDTCKICNNKYLRIYKSQHMTAHREAEYAAERKLLMAEEIKVKKEDPDDFIVSGRRKAAEKAKTVIEKYNNTMHENAHHCPKCGFSTEIESELPKHVCFDDQWDEVNDSDESVKMEHSSDEEDTDDSDIDSNISEEEREACEQENNKKKRYSDTVHSKVVRLPYQVKNTNAYMKRSAEEFIENYLTDEDLFPEWHSCEYEEVPESELVKYMPPIEESCNLKISDAQVWKTLKRFESEKNKGSLTMFVGASIQCASWVAGAGPAQFLSLVSHGDADVPRYAWDSSHSSPGLVQIWDCGNFVQYTPKFALGLAHDYGTFWAMDWCPSGARDLFDFVPKDNQMHRLGLFAAACSNGSAYIFSVPYPSSITENEKLFYKIKPVAELRLTMSRDRKNYQATSIKWSAQKGHSQVVVGYSDGCLGFYDLNGDSPLLRSTENNITVFYPYHDERVQNFCIEDVDVYPRGGAAGGAATGVVCAGGAGGAGAGALQSHVACARVLFPPHWPAALLAGDDCLVNQSINELEWYGSGRRLGGVRMAAGCAWCGRVAAAALPLLRLLRLHPAYTDVHKQVIGTIRMVTLGTKRKRQNDELGMIVEPITYNDVIKKYGIEFNPMVSKDRATQQRITAMPRDAYPERFPLSDVTSMKFCPTAQHHDRLAVALHAGFIFIISV